MSNGLYKYLPENSAGTSETTEKVGSGLYKYVGKTTKSEAPAETYTPTKSKKTARQTAQEDFWALKTASATEQALAAADALNGGVSEAQKAKAAADTAKALQKYKESGVKDLPTGNPIKIRALGAGDYKNTKADEAINSAVYGTASSLTEIQRQLLAPTGELTIGQNAQAAVKGESQSAAEKEKAARQKVTQKKVGQLSDYLAQRSIEEQEKAKEGLSAGGKLMVDLGINGTQILGDAAMNLLLPGSGLPSMATRVYGQSAGQARREGKNEWQQVLTGAKSSAIEVVTERMFDGLAGIYGDAEASNMVKTLSRKLAKTDAGRTVTRWLINSTGEGIEEIASDVLNPIADKVLGLSKGPLYTKADIPQMLYDGLIGAMMGGVGGAVNIATGEEANTNARLRTYEEAVKDAQSNFTYEGDKIKGLSKKGLLRASQNFSDNMEAQKARQGSFELLTGIQGAELPGRMDTQTGVLNNGRLLTAADMAEYTQKQKGRTDIVDDYLAEKAKSRQRDTFSKEIDNWDGKSPKTFSLNMNSEPLKSIGVQAEKIVLHSDKIGKILKKHPGMSLNVVKQAPDIINNPIVTLKSKTVKSRIVMFGEAVDENGAPVLVALELTPKQNGGNLTNMSEVSSLYGKNKDVAGFVKRSDVLYLDPNKNRTDTWLQGLGLQSPSDATAYGSVGNISYADGGVNIKGIPFEKLTKMSNDSEPIKTSLAADSDAGAQESLLDNSISESLKKSNTNMLPGNSQTLGDLPAAESVTENAESGAEKISTREEILKSTKMPCMKRSPNCSPRSKTERFRKRWTLWPHRSSSRRRISTQSIRPLKSCGTNPP